MEATTVIGYAYEADTHCLDCARDRFGDALNAPETEDLDGNPIGVMFCGEAADTPLHCSDCRAFLEGGALTEEGERYVVDALLFPPAPEYGESKVLAGWREAFNYLADRIADAERAALDNGKCPVVDMSLEDENGEACGCCGYHHRESWNGDCRYDREAFEFHDIAGFPECYDRTGGSFISRAERRYRHKAEEREAIIKDACPEAVVIFDNENRSASSRRIFNALATFILDHAGETLLEPKELDYDTGGDAIAEAVTRAEIIARNIGGVCLDWHWAYDSVLVAGPPSLWTAD